jgi:hypothetical protein
MSTSIDAQQLTTLLRISSELDIIGDVTATVANPSELLAWAHALPEPTLCAWRAEDSTNRYVQVTAACHRNPVHGRVTAVLTGDDHRQFWAALLPDGDLAAGEEQLLPLTALTTAWSATSPGTVNLVACLVAGRIARLLAVG